MSKRRRASYGSLQRLTYELGKKSIIVGLRRNPRGVTVHRVVNGERENQYYRNFYDVYDLLLKMIKESESK